jgi:hypothetical protein
MLDLSVFQEKTLDIKLLDGSIIKIKKPTQALIIEVMKLRGINEQDDGVEIISTLSGLVHKILNSNNTGKTFTKEFIDETLDFNMCMAIVQAYGEFITEIQNNPN